MSELCCYQFRALMECGTSSSYILFPSFIKFQNTGRFQLPTLYCVSQKLGSAGFLSINIIIPAFQVILNTSSCCMYFVP